VNARDADSDPSGRHEGGELDFKRTWIGWRGVLFFLTGGLGLAGASLDPSSGWPWWARAAGLPIGALAVGYTLQQCVKRSRI
jgi:hypothetical protein